MPLVFVHGVAARQTPEQKHATAQRTALFRQIVFNSESAHIFNPDWGSAGVVFSENMPWLPVPGKFETFGSKPVAGSPLGEIGLSQIASRDAAQAIDLVVSAALNEAMRNHISPSESLVTDENAIGFAKAAADYLGVMNVLDTDEPKGLPRLDGGNDQNFAQTLAQDLDRLGSIDAYGGGVGQTIKDAVSALGGWIGNSLSDTVLRAKRADLSRSVAYFLGDIFVYLRHRDTEGAKGDRARLFSPIVSDLLEAWKSPRAEREPFVVVGHSLGGVLLYDILTDPYCIERLRDEGCEDLQIDLLLTVGSQVGFFKDLRMYEKGDVYAEQRLPRPALVKNWLNVFDYTDVFSFTCVPFFEGVDDFGYDTVIDVFQAHSYYFKRPSFYMRMERRLRGLGYL